MRIIKSVGYGAYGQNPFQPDFTICKSEGGTANCPSEYVKEFAGLSETWASHKLCLGLIMALAVTCVVLYRR